MVSTVPSTLLWDLHSLGINKCDKFYIKRIPRLQIQFQFQFAVPIDLFTNKSVSNLHFDSLSIHNYRTNRIHPGKILSSNKIPLNKRFASVSINPPLNPIPRPSFSSFHIPIYHPLSSSFTRGLITVHSQSVAQSLCVSTTP